MEVSKLTISENLRRPKITPKKVGELRLQHLKEISEDRWLDLDEVCKLVGKDEKKATIVAWLNYNTKKGTIETMTSGEAYHNGRPKLLYRFSKTQKEVKRQKKVEQKKAKVKSKFNLEIENLIKSIDKIKDKSSDYKCGYYEALISQIQQKYLLDNTLDIE